MSTLLEQSIPPLLSITDFTFSLADSVAMVKRQISDVLVLPLLAKQVHAGKQPHPLIMMYHFITGDYIQGTVVSKLTPQGFFWLRIVGRENSGTLSVISQSIRCDTLLGRGCVS